MRLRRIVPLLIAACLLGAWPLPGRAEVDVVISTQFAPPPLPVYDLPEFPGPGYIWMPGYWAWGPYGFYWVPGTWVLPPEVGLLWTPGYWGWSPDGVYVWHAGYWAPQVGFYGGINYGYGYFGEGFAGGYWQNNVFFYNVAVFNLRGAHFEHVYRRPWHETVTTRVSFNGGVGGIAARPSRADEAAAHERHFGATEVQRHHEQTAASDRALLSSVNNGRPGIAATSRPAAFTGRGTVRARNAETAPYTGAPRTPAASVAPNATRDERSSRRAPSGGGPQNAAPATTAAPQAAPDSRLHRSPAAQGSATTAPPQAGTPERRSETRDSRRPPATGAATPAPAPAAAPTAVPRRDETRTPRHEAPPSAERGRSGPPPSPQAGAPPHAPTGPARAAAPAAQAPHPPAPAAAPAPAPAAAAPPAQHGGQPDHGGQQDRGDHGAGDRDRH